jgi:hypothetical protein
LDGPARHGRLECGLPFTNRGSERNFSPLVSFHCVASNKIIRTEPFDDLARLGRPPTHVRGGPHESFVIFFGLLDPAAAVEQLFYELHSAHIVKVRVRAEVAGCVLVALVFPGSKSPASPSWS